MGSSQNNFGPLKLFVKLNFTLFNIKDWLETSEKCSASIMLVDVTRKLRPANDIKTMTVLCAEFCG